MKGTCTWIALVTLVIASPVRAQDAAATAGDGAPGANASASNSSAQEKPRSLEQRAEDILDSLHHRGIYPKLGSIEAGSGASFGGRLRHPHMIFGVLGAEVEAMFSIRGYQQYGVRVGVIDEARDMMGLGGPGANITELFNDDERTQPGTALFLLATHQRSPRVDFFGLNGDAGPRSDFALSRAGLEVVGQWQPLPWLGLSARGGVTEFRASAGRNPDTVDVTQAYSMAATPGLLDQPRYITLGVAATGDTRNSPDVPTRGFFGGVVLWRMIPDSGTEQAFTRLAVDTRAFVPMGSESHVAAFRFLGSVDNSPASSPTPFYLQYWLGGSQTLRAFPSYQMRGEALAHLSAEYRWRVFRRINLVAFTDVGTVATNLQGLFSSDIEVAPGLGVWLRGNDRLYFRVDWARSPAGHRWLWSLNPSF